MVRKRERENPCYVCGHYHKFEDGEVCGICGHRLQDAGEKSSLDTPSAFATEILPSFLYLGSYDNASRAELLKAQGISRILNTVPTCQNLYKNSFTYKTMKGDQSLPFDDCYDFIEQSRVESARILVHCMSGQNRSPAVVIAYLMRSKGWRLAESYQWVKARRPSINLTPAVGEQLHLYEAKIFGPNDTHTATVSSEKESGFNISFPSTTSTAAGAGFSTLPPPLSQSFLANTSGNGSDHASNFVFGAGRQQQEIEAGSANIMDNAMDSSS
ncbi:hypothetical protein KP509_15G008000 [Ceratopteris richardii]|uniref:Uncharacterized protein n=1 Tax=Ceratopteris richardii TaxID=49495 RepID=A0A8T2T6M3_CERRI|nr:hypothetical protein KP509_15G008000 [Ceratopteris richardii]